MKLQEFEFDSFLNPSGFYFPGIGEFWLALDVSLALQEWKIEIDETTLEDSLINTISNNLRVEIE